MNAWSKTPPIPTGWESRIDAIRRLSVSVLVTCLAEFFKSDVGHGRFTTRRLWDLHMAALEEHVPRQLLARTALEYLRLTEPGVYETVRPEFEVSGKTVELLVHKFLFQIVNIEAAFHNALGSDTHWAELLSKISALEKQKQKLEETIRHQEKILERLEKRSHDQQIAWYGRVVHLTSAVAASITGKDSDGKDDDDAVIVKDSGGRDSHQVASTAAKSLIIEAPTQQQQPQASASATAVGSISADGVRKYRLVHPEELVSVSVVAQQGQTVFALQDRELWNEATIAEVLEPAPDSSDGLVYRVCFNKTTKITKNLRPSQVALFETAEQRLEQYPVGARVVSSYTDDRGLIFYYSAIVAEPPGERNSRRYLLFFDDGFAQYSPPNDVRRVLHQTPHNWREVAQDSQEFVRAYLDKYPNRTMLRLRPGLTIRVELRGEWLTAVVEQVDASLVQVRFPTRSGCREWLYRGSTRLEDLFKAMLIREKAAAVAASNAAAAAAAASATPSGDQQPAIRQAFARKSSIGGAVRRQHKHQPQQQQLLQTLSSSSSAPTLLTHRQQSSASVGEDASEEDACYEEARAGVMVASIDSSSLRQLRPFPHQHGQVCEPNCLLLVGSISDEADSDKSEQERLELALSVDRNPLDVPLLLGWHRFIVRLGGSGRVRRRELIEYATPCGRRLRNPADLDRYLGHTGSRLHPMNFCFDPLVRVATEFCATGVRRQLADLSYGKERITVPAVNCLDAEEPPYIDYTSQRMPILNVCTNESDRGFLVCCDCTDGCRDRTKCACLRLTAEASAIVTGRTDSRPAYENGRLVRALIGGVYECNSGCACQDWQCRNRLVQRGLNARLQIFKTSRKGWGLRPLHDLPKGAFVCVYAGELYSEELAVQYCDQFGDEYQADLDHLEVMEQEKVGYEAGVLEPLQQQQQHRRQQKDQTESQSSAEDNEDNNRNSERPSSDNGEDNDAEQEEATSVSPPDDDEYLANDGQDDDDDDVDNDDENDEDYCTGSDRRRKRPGNNVGKKSAATKSKRIRLTTDELQGESAETDASTVPKDSSRRIDGAGNPSASQLGDEQDDDVVEEAIEAFVPDDNPADDILDAAGPAACLRAFLGEAQPYIMDAKRIGNLGRYLNHSCAPNVIVQNVFVNTHDPRFPEIAFFTCARVRAGDELCWDYNYQVGSVPGKTLRCFCRAKDCRGRLL